MALEHQPPVLTVVLVAIFLGLAFAPFLFPGVKALSVAAKVLIFVVPVKVLSCGVSCSIRSRKICVSSTEEIFLVCSADEISRSEALSISVIR